MSIDFRLTSRRGNRKTPSPLVQLDRESPGRAAMTELTRGSFVPKVSVVIPALNEARNLPHVFSRLPTGLHEVIVVDGHSVDDTLSAARRLRPEVRIIAQNRRGKGNALACGFAAATGDIIVMVDADGSADPAEIPRFVWALLDGADYAKGSRFAKAGAAATSPGCAGPVTGPSASWSTSCAGPGIRIFATDTTPSGGATSRCWDWTPSRLSRPTGPGSGVTDSRSRR